MYSVLKYFVGYLFLVYFMFALDVSLVLSVLLWSVCRSRLIRICSIDRFSNSVTFLKSNLVKRTAQEAINEFIESVGSCTFQSCMCNEPWIHTRGSYEISTCSVFLNLMQKSSKKLNPLKVFNLTKYREVLVKYSLLEMPLWIWHQLREGRMEKQESGIRNPEPEPELKLRPR